MVLDLLRVRVTDLRLEGDLDRRELSVALSIMGVHFRREDESEQREVTNGDKCAGDDEEDRWVLAAAAAAATSLRMRARLDHAHARVQL